MDLRKAINDLLQENSTSTYEFGCVMLYFSFPQMKDLHNLIQKEDIYEDPDGDLTYGLEDEPHCTLLYGLHEGVSKEEVEDILNKFKFEGCKIFNPSKFDNEKYDVFKFDVMGGPLEDVNKMLSKLPHKESEYDFHPHLTVGYLQPGKAQKYIGLFNKEEFNEFNLVPQYAVYSYPDGSKDKIQIKYEN